MRERAGPPSPGAVSPARWAPETCARARGAASILRVCAEVPGVARGYCALSEGQGPHNQGKSVSAQKRKTSATEMQRQRQTTRDNQMLI